MTVDRRVLFVGDSFVAGAGDPAGCGWVGRAVRAAFAAGLPLTPYNLGVRRETSAQVAARWAAEARPRIAAEARCGVVFAVGANDAIVADGARRLAPERSAAAFAGLLDAAAAIGLPAFAVGPPPVGERAADDRVERLSARFAELAAARGVPFASVVAALRASPVWCAEAAAGDGAHPRAGGYELLAELVLAGGWLDWLGRLG